MFVKLGQVLSHPHRPHLTRRPPPSSACCRTTCGPPPARRHRRAAGGGARRPGARACSSAFDWQPLAAASIGQVYRAQLPDGSPVVVKVQRPGIDDSVRVDLSVLEELGTWSESRTSWGPSTAWRTSSTSSVPACARSSTTGSRRATRTRSPRACPPSSRIYVPYVYEELSTSRVLVMEWLDGASVREVDWAEARPPTARSSPTSCLRTFLEQMLQEGVFHADPHPGNVMLLADGQLALIDFGAAGRLDPVQQAALRDMMAGVSRRDADAVAQAVLQVGRLRRGVDVNDFERALARFMAQHLAPGSKPDAAMFNAMLRLMFEYGITMPAEWSTFFRALIVLEGTLTTIAPGYSVIDAAESIASQWVRSLINPGSVQQAVRDEILRTVPMLRRLPRHVDRAFTMPGARRPAGAGHALLRRARRAHRHQAGEPARARVPLRGHRPRLGRAHRHRGRARVLRQHVAAPGVRLLRPVLRHRARHARDRGRAPRRPGLTRVADRARQVLQLLGSAQPPRIVPGAGEAYPVA